jgi:hypothetical protein
MMAQRTGAYSRPASGDERARESASEIRNPPVQDPAATIESQNVTAL